MSHVVYVLTPDPEGYCNPHGWIEVHGRESSAHLSALKKCRAEIDAEVVGDEQWDVPPLSEHYRLGLSFEEDGNATFVSVMLEDDDHESSLFRDFVVWTLECPG